MSGRPAPKVRPERVGPIRVELISVGREMLRGRISDSNAQELARYLTQRGAVVGRIVIIDDEESSIAAALAEALGRNPNLVVTTGGLGPALDDRTLSAVAEALGLPLALHAGARSLVGASYQSLSEKRLVNRGGMTAAREKMCRLPVGGIAVPNPVGISPGVICRLPGGAAVLCLPGSPEEMLAVLEGAVPLLRDLGPKAGMARREVESPTADESSLRPLLDRLTRELPDVWVHTHPGAGRGRRSKTMITLEATGANQRAAIDAVESAVKRLLALAAGNP